MNLRLSICSLLAVCLSLFAMRATDAATYSESTLGDISGTPASPTTWALDPGPNPLSGTAGGGDVDLLHVVVPSGHVLTSIFLNNYVSQIQTVSFMGVASGPTWPTGTDYDVDAEAIMGWVHFGVTPGASIGDDLLPVMSVADFSPGFTLPLAGSDYTFDIQDVDFSMNYAMTFHVSPVPEPSALALLISMALGARRLRPIGSGR